VTAGTEGGPGPSPPGLFTYAPPVGDPPHLIPTGNLWISLSEIDRGDGSVGSLGALVERSLGLVEAHGVGPGQGLVQPVLVVDGRPTAMSGLTWRRDGNWLPRFSGTCPVGSLEGRYCAPVGERGVVLRLTFTNATTRSVAVELGWSGTWATSSVTHLRPKAIGGEPFGRDDPWTGSRSVSVTAGFPLLAIAWQPGDGMELAHDADHPGWHATGTHQVEAGGQRTADLFIGVATEPDGAAATALHLRRRGFDALWDATMGWLDTHALAVPDPRPGLAERINANLFFNYFFAQGNCLDTGRPVLVTSRSRHYYVAAAFWSRDAFCWTFPALLLTDRARAREVLVASLAAAGPRVADHALYLNGTSLYPGFELDQAAAPIVAIWRYVEAVGDRSILEEEAVRAALDGLDELVGPWRHREWDLYGTFLLPTDDPTGYPFVTTANALVAAAFEALAALQEAVMVGDGDGQRKEGGAGASGHRRHAAAIRAAMRDRLVVEGPTGPAWAWACDAEGNTETRDEPPLGLRTLPYWGVGTVDDPVNRATRAWLADHNPHRVAGRFPGAGSPHFPHPSGFDLANRLLVGDAADGDPLDQLVEVPMDEGLACESWDVDTGQVRTGAAMASMAGLLVWTAWEHLAGRRRWDQPPGHGVAGR
jgi:hypothetical protein